MSVVVERKERKKGEGESMDGCNEPREEGVSLIQLDDYNKLNLR